MSISDGNLITSQSFHGEDYLVKMSAIDQNLEISLTSKQTGEEWQCSYEHSYIENLTYKTGNYKDFDIFVSMLKAGLLKTRDCISLDLLTYEDLEELRIKRIKTHQSRTNLVNKSGINRRYLILTYNVEFDRIVYPLPLEYCGPPDPQVLLATIRKLERELVKSKDELNMKEQKSPDNRRILQLQQRITEVTGENLMLKEQLASFKHMKPINSHSQVRILQDSIIKLEKSVLSERQTHKRLVEKMHEEKLGLMKEINHLKDNEFMLKHQLNRYKNFKKETTDTLNSPNNIQSVKSPYARPRRTQSLGGQLNKSKNPIVTKSVDNIRKPKIMNYECIRNQSRSSSRSSNKSDSESCSRNIHYNNNNNNNNRAKSRNNSKERISRRQSPVDRSPRSLSPASSNGSSLARSEKLKLRMKSSEQEFKTLENRIKNLQKMLQNGLNI